MKILYRKEIDVPSGFYCTNCQCLKNFDEVEEFIKKRYDEHENANKPKRKFRAVTIREHCAKAECEKCEYNYGFGCFYSDFNEIHKEREDCKPYKKRNGKYILVEVRE